VCVCAWRRSVRAALFILVGIKFQNQRHLKFKEKTFLNQKK